MAQENRSLLVVDDDFAYGVKYGYYPQLQNDIDNGALNVMSIKDARETGSLCTVPSDDKENFYVYNPYVNDKNYVDLSDPNLEQNFGIAQCNAIKESLRRLGVKEVKINKVSEQYAEDAYHGNGRANKGPVGGEVAVDYKRDKRFDFTLNIEMTDEKNQPSQYEDACNYIYSHGMANNPFLSEWLSVLKERHQITGRETINVSFFEEINKALDIAAKITTPAYSVNAGFNMNSKKINKLNIKLSVNFG